MSDVDDFVRRNPGVISEERLVFCHYLERRGQRFYIDFGYENAEEKTWDDMDMCEGMLQAIN